LEENKAMSFAARAGKNLKPSSMELGGSDAFIVLEDADLDHTIKWAVWGRMYNAGQTCCPAKRLLRHNFREIPRLAAVTRWDLPNQYSSEVLWSKDPKSRIL
jgi:acyl-CoA reductase-like NAD-dependent aldehyde dehydrogenase